MGWGTVDLILKVCVYVSAQVRFVDSLSSLADNNIMAHLGDVENIYLIWHEAPFSSWDYLNHHWGTGMDNYLRETKRLAVITQP